MFVGDTKIWTEVLNIATYVVLNGCRSGYLNLTLQNVSDCTLGMKTERLNSTRKVAVKFFFRETQGRKSP